MNLTQLAALVRQTLGREPSSAYEVLAVVQQLSPADLSDKDKMIKLLGEFDLNSPAGRTLVNSLSATDRDSSLDEFAITLASIPTVGKVPATPLRIVSRAARSRIRDRVAVSVVSRVTGRATADTIQGRVTRAISNIPGGGPVRLKDIPATTRTLIQFDRERELYRIPTTKRYHPSRYPLGQPQRPLFSSQSGKGIVSPSRIFPGVPVIKTTQKPPLLGTTLTGRVAKVDRLAQMAGRDIFGSPMGKATIARNIPRVGAAALLAGVTTGSGLLQQRADYRRTERDLAQQLADQILQDIKMRTPVDSGNLRSSLRVNVNFGAGGLIGSSGVEFRGGGIYAYLVIGGNVGGTHTLARIEITSDIPYAYYVEFGTINAGAQPYIRPVLNRTHSMISKNVQVGTNISLSLPTGRTAFRTTQEVDGGRIRIGLTPTG